MATLYLKKKAEKTASIIGPAEKKILIFIYKKKITTAIIGPAMAGPTGPFATALRYILNAFSHS